MLHWFNNNVSVNAVQIKSLKPIHKSLYGLYTSEIVSLLLHGADLRAFNDDVPEVDPDVDVVTVDSVSAAVVVTADGATITTVTSTNKYDNMSQQIIHLDSNC